MSGPMDTLTEVVARDLMKKVAGGDQHAFEELWRAYEKPLFHMAVNLLRDPDGARDVMQEAALAIWNGSKQFKGNCKPFSWMWAIVRHKALDALRSNLNTAPAEDTRFDKGWAAQRPELDAVICEALKRLSPEHRLIIILTHYMNFSQWHISQVIHCPVGTVKSRLAKALQQLREVWDSPLKIETFTHRVVSR